MTAQIQYYGEYLKLTSDQRRRVDALIRKWWEDHWELQYRVVSDRSEKETWKQRLEAMRGTHRQRWDAFCLQISADLTPEQSDRLSGNYPGQFDFKYDSASAKAQE